MTIKDRRDSFCGKMSACNNLTQYGIPYSLTTLHTEAPDSDLFRKDLDWFAAVCRVVRGLRRLRIGAIGARPAAFNTVRYSEKILEAQRHLHRAHRSLGNPRPHRADGRYDDPGAARNWRPSSKYVSTDGIPHEALLKMAKLGAVIDGWMKETEVRHQRRAVLDLDGRILRRGALHRDEHDEQRTCMSSACEVDICGVVGMHALQLASGTPSALLDWNNNYGDDPDKAVCFHCSNLPKHFFADVRMDFQEIIAGTVGKENTFGTCVGR